MPSIDCLLDPRRGEGGDTLADAADYWNGADRASLTVVELETPALAPGLAEISCPAK